MKKDLLLVALIIAFSLGVSTAYGQSGRNRGSQAEPKIEKTGSKAAPSGGAVIPSEESGEGLSESRVAPEGETVEDDVVRIDTSLVTVPVTVLDRNGMYIPYLRRQDFRLFEDSIEQKIAYFATVDTPFTVILVLDTSGSTEFRLDDIQNAALTFVSKLKPEDSVMVMEFDDRIDVLCKPTTDRNVITQAIRRTRTGGGTRLYDVVDNVLRKQLQTINQRKAVVLFTDGVDTTSGSATYESTIREAEESDAPIYTLDYSTQGPNNILSGQGSRGTIFGIPIPRPGIPGGGGTGGADAEDYRLARVYLQTLSEKTGGRFYNADTLTGIGQAFASIAEELSRQYSLGYYPKRVAKAGVRRQIKVRAVEPNMVVKARGSYIPPTKKTTPQTQPAGEPAKEKKPYGKVTETN